MKGQEIKEKSLLYNMRTSLKVFAEHIILVLVGMVATRIDFLSDLNPLGVLLAAAVPTVYTLSAGLGAFFGYLFITANAMPFRYVAALFAVVSIKLLTKDIKSLSRSPAFSAVAVLLSQTICNLVVVFGGGAEGLILILEGVLAAGLTYFVGRVFYINLTGTIGLNSEELACVVITIDLILMALMPINIFGFSIGRMLTISLILAAARFGSVSGGTVAGCSVGFAIAITQGDARLVCMYAVGGMISGLFSTAGRIFGILGFIVPQFICLGMFGQDFATIIIILETLLGLALFLFMPKSLCVTLASFFAPPVRLEGLEGMRKSLVMRLRLASGALCDVSGTIEEVAKRLKKINIPDISDIFSLCEKDACVGCSFRVNCWETDKRRTYEALGNLCAGIRKGDSSLENAHEEFYKKCLRRERIEDSLKKHYTEYLLRLSAEERIENVRGVVSDQFDGISDMLLDLAFEFDTARHYDIDTAHQIVSALREINLLTTDCNCSVDKYGRMTVEAKIHNVDENRISRKQILESVERATERVFLPPTLRQIEDIIYLVLTEKPKFYLDIGLSQISAGSKDICGDSGDYFGDGQGKFYMLLSDGMGTGGRAAVDGAMTTGLMKRLIKAGFGMECSLRIVNSALLYKSSEESLSTVDVAAFDLHSGKLELYKAGAAPTFVRKSGKVGRAQSNSLPVGILRDVGFDRSTLTLKKDDIIVIISDGAAGENTDWITKELETTEEDNPQRLADSLAESALRRSDKKHPDDITVMVGFIQKRF